MTRRSQNGGLGVTYYYVANGFAASNVPGVDAYCWGWYQADAATTHIYQQFYGYLAPMTWTEVAIDIEGVNTLGWDAGNYTANRQTFNGFTDQGVGQSTTV